MYFPGATPLCIAAQEKFLDVVTVLCNHGADPNHADRFGRTALKVGPVYTVALVDFIVILIHYHQPSGHLSTRFYRDFEYYARMQTFQRSLNTQSHCGVFVNACFVATKNDWLFSYNFYSQLAVF